MGMFLILWLSSEITSEEWRYEHPSYECTKSSISLKDLRALINVRVICFFIIYAFFVSVNLRLVRWLIYILKLFGLVTVLFWCVCVRSIRTPKENSFNRCFVFNQVFRIMSSSHNLSTKFVEKKFLDFSW